MLLMITGTVLLVWVLLKTYKYFHASRWLSTNGNINSITISKAYDSIRFAKQESLYPVVSYEYQVDGKSYKGKIASFDIRNLFKETNTFSGNESMPWDHWSENSVISVFYNPKSPCQSVLIRSLLPKRKSHYLALTITGLLLIGIGTLLERVSA